MSASDQSPAEGVVTRYATAWREGHLATGNGAPVSVDQDRHLVDRAWSTPD